jgi:hypothetical protein
MDDSARWRVVLAAACALLVSCASGPETPSAALDYRPASRSTLMSNRDLRFVVAQWRRGAELTTVLAQRQTGASPRPVARLVQAGQGPTLQVSIHRLPVRTSPTSPADDERAALEQLYALVLRQEPQARYCLGSGGQRCDPMRDGVSHAEVLLALADARERVVPHTPATVPWRAVEMAGSPIRSVDADVVAVRATAREVPLEGVAIYFNRAPHSLCAARTGADGVAVCRLVDPHGDDHEHDHAAPVVATFPGDVRTDRVLLPTTYVLPTPDVVPPPFAPRIPGIRPGKR